MSGVLSQPEYPVPAPVPAGTPPCVAVRPPGSKSLTNRALLLAALAGGTSTLTGGLLDADDAQRMLAALDTLGVGVERADAGTLRIAGCSGRFPRGGELFLNNAGTATRFLTAAACLASAPVTIDGNARMRERPIGELVELLRRLGVRVDELEQPGFVPVRVHPCAIEGGELSVSTTLSSQYLSALMMIGPCMASGITLVPEGAITSPSYLRMTLGLMERVGLGGLLDASPDLRSIRINNGQMPAFSYDVEPDASGATYFWAAGALVPGARVTVAGLDDASLQGDAHFADLIGQMGAAVDRSPLADGTPATTVAAPQSLRPVDADLADMPDAAMTLGVLCAFASGPSTIRGLRTLRVKETDRIAAMQNELGKIGVRVEVFSYTDADGAPDEGITITPPESGVDCSPSAPEVRFDTYDDHRMAMSSALVGLRRPNVIINEPGCVAKTYARFWDDFERLFEAGGPR